MNCLTVAVSAQLGEILFEVANLSWSKELFRNLSVSLWCGLINPHILKNPNIFSQICMKMLPYACMSTLNKLSTLISTIKYYVLKLYLIQYYARFRVHHKKSKSGICQKLPLLLRSQLLVNSKIFFGPSIDTSWFEVFEDSMIKSTPQGSLELLMASKNPKISWSVHSISKEVLGWSCFFNTNS